MKRAKLYAIKRPTRNDSVFDEIFLDFERDYLRLHEESATRKQFAFCYCRRYRSHGGETARRSSRLGPDQLPQGEQGRGFKMADCGPRGGAPSIESR